MESKGGFAKLCGPKFESYIKWVKVHLGSLPEDSNRVCIENDG